MTTPQKREEPVTQVDELLEESIEDVDHVAETHVDGSKPSAPKKPKKPKKSLTQRYKGTVFPSELACVSKWEDIEVGKVYRVMAVGATPRSRTGFVLVPLNEQ